MILDQHGIPYASTGAPFEGASQAPRMSNFIGSSFGPNTAIHMGLRTLRGRSRQAIRNNPLAKGAQKIKTANMVGTGIRPRFNFKNDPGLKSQVQETWEDSVPELDWNGTADFYGQQSIVSDAVFSDGEALAVFRPMSKYDDLAVPLQIQLLEADHLDLDYSTVLPNGNTVRMGIEYDKRGKRVAYHLHRDHPGEHFLNNDTGRQQLLASDVMHVFDPTRPGQQRGLPSSSSVLVKLHEIDLCVDAELVRRKTTAMFGGFIKKMNELAQPAVPQVGGTKRKTSVIPKSPALEPGTFPVLPPGWEVEFSQPRDVSGNYVAWMKQQLMDLAKGWGITYEQLTGDYPALIIHPFEQGCWSSAGPLKWNRQKPSCSCSAGRSSRDGSTPQWLLGFSISQITWRKNAGITGAITCSPNPGHGLTPTKICLGNCWRPGPAGSPMTRH